MILSDIHHQNKRIFNDEAFEIDSLTLIFQRLDLPELTSCAGVCRTWRMAACDALLWNTLDFSNLTSEFIRTMVEPNVYVRMKSDEDLTKKLKISLSLSHGSTMALIFHYNLFLTNDQFAYTAQRCPRLRRLVMPAWNRIKMSVLCYAIRSWPDLESLIMPSITNPSDLMAEIAASCKKFTELKIHGPCDILIASALVKYLPNLQVLSLRCSVLSEHVLIVLLDGLKNLKVLNISHCVTKVGRATLRPIVPMLDKSIFERASRLNQFITCPQWGCLMCARTLADEGYLRWYEYEEGLWKTDEVKSLSF